jgi:hypothetical protein
VTDRIANLVVLVEDNEQQSLVRRVLEQRGHNPRRIRFVAVPSGRGSGEQHVRREIPNQVNACRSSRGRRASALLIVMVDADAKPAETRQGEMQQACQDCPDGPPRRDEPILILVPKRNVETWIRALLGDTVDEDTDYSRAKPSGREIKMAARALTSHLQLPLESNPPGNWPPSLRGSIFVWRRIP